MSLRLFTFGLYLFILSLVYACTEGDSIAGEPTNLPDQIDYNFHIKPILSDKCFACHGPDKANQKAGLVLSTKEGAYSELQESPGKYAIVPGKARKSELVHRILAMDAESQMPPPESNLTLTENEKQLLIRWIKEGAEYKPHWAFIPPEQPSLPNIKEDSWPKTPIDKFVLKKLENEGLTPNELADKETLLRRLSLDLIGLPPTIEEIDAFLADESADAYEKVVERLLASPHYGERMALEWLDVARYADSHGYSTDGYRMMWPWRDWVIKAFNENMPFDQFITWQIAGDKLPNATKEQRLATAFLRNQKLNAEGGIVPEEFLVEYAADRTETVATAFMGLTMQCAKCHDHKYDPISQKEYYQLFDFFNDVNERGMTQNDGNSGPQVLLTTSDVEEQIAFINQKIEEQEAELSKVRNALKQQKYTEPILDLQRGLLADLDFEQVSAGILTDRADRKAQHRISGKGNLLEGKNGQGFKLSAYDVVRINNEKLDFDRSDAFSFSFWIQANYENNYMPLLFHLGGKNQGYAGYEVAILDGYPTLRLINGVPANLIAVRSPEKLAKGEWVHFAFTYDGSSRANGVRIYRNGKKEDAKILFDQLTKSFATGRKSLAIGGRQDYQQDTKGEGIMDDLKIYQRSISEVEAYALYQGEESQLDSRQFSNESLAEHYFLNRSPEQNQINGVLKTLRTEKNSILDTIPAVMVMQDLPTPRPAFLLNRGAYDAPTEEVFPGTPAAIFSFPSQLAKDRKGLAEWLTDKRNPLTARVLVNRYWQLFFGQGIVKTIEDFGNQGALPHHPELLDYLASDFIDSGWDLKALHRQIVLSATYRQSSRVTEAERKADPANELLARGPSHRLQAELIRDCALAASGLLVDKIGGPSAKPYQPDGLWAEITGNSRILDRYRADIGAQLYRRGLYTFWRRTLPPPSMVTFDAPTRDVCIVKRQETNTPLQALVLLNDPQFFEAARVLAQRVLQKNTTIDEQLTHAYRLLTGLRPETKVIDLLREHYREQEEHFSENSTAVEELLSVGRYPLDEDLPSHKVAAMSIVCNVIMSFDETIVKR